MKKIFIPILTILLICGCTMKETKLSEKKPIEIVENYFNNYQTLSTDVMNQLNETVDMMNLNDSQKDDYKEIMKRHYEDLEYEIKDEMIDGKNASVTVEITVYDYTKLLSEADEDLNNNKDKFNDENGNYDDYLYNEYRIEKLKNAKEKVTYTLEIKLNKKDDEWQLEELSDENESKINGTYM